MKKLKYNTMRPRLLKPSVTQGTVDEKDMGP